MSLIVFHTRNVRRALKAPASLGIELLMLAGVAAVVGALVLMSEQATQHFEQHVQIDLSLWALPRYTLLSLTRGCAAYVLSLAFTLVYGTIAAHNPRAEKVMVPALDVLQSLPVLAFLPGLVLSLIYLFPTRELGLEIACVIMIFTGQVWNMTFSYYGSIRGAPAPLWEAARVYRMSRWRLFTVLELPASMIGLVWNSMMSMAGGWFFLILTEAFNLNGRDFRLPGIGSYMSEAMAGFHSRVPRTWTPVVAAVIAMVVMIVAVDQLFWRPIVAWSERFKLEETAEVEKPQSWVLGLMRKSLLYTWGRVLVQRWRRWRETMDAGFEVVPVAAAQAEPAPALDYRSEALSVVPENRVRAASGAGGGGSVAWRAALGWVVVGALSAGAAWGAWALVRLLIRLPLHDPGSHADWLTVFGSLLASFARTTAAVLVGAAWTLPAGILIGLSPRWSQRLQPVVQVVASFPAPMLFILVTLAILAMHIPFNLGCTVLMLMGAQWYILFNVIAGAMAIPGDLKEVGRLYRTPRLRQWTRLYVPCVFPYLVTGLITAAGGAWNATIVSEYVQAGDHTYVAYGLGAIISEATNSGNYPLLAAGIVTMAVSVVLLNRLVWKRLYRVAEQRYSLNS